ncbi:MAG: DUF1902 domain-containing protein [Candidatus Margulisbacteria bacterium]|jgi:hypothetical protein|nr:DUF1902 domain-containing protein [Candidatus Margulisiibacteriota bacterium]
MQNYNIALVWDEEAQVWLAKNDQIPLAMESGSFDALIERVKTAVPELLELNAEKHQAVHLLFKAERLAQVA